MSRLKVGDIVRISPDSDYYMDNDLDNPININGKIVNITNDGCLDYFVLWDNNCDNVYDESDLVLIEESNLKIENDKLRNEVEELKNEIEELKSTLKKKRLLIG